MGRLTNGKDGGLGYLVLMVLMLLFRFPSGGGRPTKFALYADMGVFVAEGKPAPPVKSLPVILFIFPRRRLDT